MLRWFRSEISLYLFDLISFSFPQLNDDYYECLTPHTVIELIEACKKGTPPPVGKWGSLPMNGQVSCEGPLGKTSLFGDPAGPGFRMRPDADLVPKVNPADVKNLMGY